MLTTVTKISCDTSINKTKVLRESLTADRGSEHTKQADKAVFLGETASSYTSISSLIKVSYGCGYRDVHEILSFNLNFHIDGHLQNRQLIIFIRITCYRCHSITLYEHFGQGLKEGQLAVFA